MASLLTEANGTLILKQAACQVLIGIISWKWYHVVYMNMKYLGCVSNIHKALMTKRERTRKKRRKRRDQQRRKKGKKEKQMK